MLKYTIYIEDDRMEFTSDKQISLEAIAEKYGVKEENIVFVDFEECEA